MLFTLLFWFLWIFSHFVSGETIFPKFNAAPRLGAIIKCGLLPLKPLLTPFLFSSYQSPLTRVAKLAGYFGKKVMFHDNYLASLKYFQFIDVKILTGSVRHSAGKGAWQTEFESQMVEEEKHILKGILWFPHAHCDTCAHTNTYAHECTCIHTYEHTYTFTHIYMQSLLIIHIYAQKISNKWVWLGRTVRPDLKYVESRHIAVGSVTLIYVLRSGTSKDNLQKQV